MINVVIDTLRQTGMHVEATAATGLASQCLHGGKTAHSAFAIPTNKPLDSRSVCNVSKQKDHGKRLSMLSLIVIDEAASMNRYAFTAIDKLMQVPLFVRNLILGRKRVSAAVRRMCRRLVRRPPSNFGDRRAWHRDRLYCRVLTVLGTMV